MGREGADTQVGAERGGCRHAGVSQFGNSGVNDNITSLAPAVADASALTCVPDLNEYLI